MEVEAIALFDPAEHEALSNDPWDGSRADAYVERIVREADAGYDADIDWALHPEDRYGDETRAGYGVYSGAAGSMWALTALARRRTMELRNDYAAAIARCEDRYRSQPADAGSSVPSYFVGAAGIALARYAICGDLAALDRLAGDMRANAGNPTREWLWGSPGTAMAGLLVRERDGDRRFDAILRDVADELWATWDTRPGDGGSLWEQDMYGRRCRYVGAGHGAIGNITPLLAMADLLPAYRRRTLHVRIAELLERYAIVEGDACSWSSLGGPMSHNRMQWCHGAPGVITACALSARRRRDRGCPARGRRGNLASGPGAQGADVVPRHGRKRFCFSALGRTNR